jgi:hypothetical protein
MERAVRRRAVEAINWSLPAVNVDRKGPTSDLLAQAERDQFGGLRRASYRYDDVLVTLNAVGHRSAGCIPRQGNLRDKLAVVRVQRQESWVQHSSLNFERIPSW